MSSLEQRIASRPPRKITIRLQKSNFDVSEPILAKIDEYRQDPIIQKPILYRLEVESFSCDVKLPIFQPLLDPENLPNGTIYGFTLKHGSDSVTRNMVFQPQNTSLTPDQFAYYHVYSYQHVVQMINDTLELAFNDLASTGSLPTTKVPFFTIDTEDSFKMSLICDKAGFDQVSVAEPIVIFCNNAMERLLAGFYFIYASSGNEYAKMIIESTVANTVDDSYSQVLISQEQPSSLSNWSAIKSIAFLSSNLPVRRSLIGHDGEYGVSESNDGVATSRDLSIITEIPMNELTVDQMGTITYRPAYEKLLDLESSSQIQNLSVQLYYSDGPHFHPLEIHTGGHVDLVLNFHLRDDL